MLFYKVDIKLHDIEAEPGRSERSEQAIAIQMKTEDFGNGRYARNLLERAVMKQASRLVSMDVDAVTKADIGRLTADDFEAPVVTRQEPRRIGFSA